MAIVEAQSHMGYEKTLCCSLDLGKQLSNHGRARVCGGGGGVVVSVAVVVVDAVIVIVVACVRAFVRVCVAAAVEVYDAYVFTR